jgi:hypothetical protein
MGFNVSALTDYVNEQRIPLIGAATITGTTARLITKIPGLKGATTVNKIATDIFFQDGASCGNTPSGDVTFTQRTLTPAPLRLVMDFCPRELEKKALSLQMSAGSTYESLPFEEVITNLIVRNMRQKLEQMIWRSNASTGTGNFQFFDGLITNIETGSNFIDANSASYGAPITAFNIASMQEVIERLAFFTPDAVTESADSLKIWLGLDKFRLLNNSLLRGSSTVGQLQNMDMASAENSMFWPGTNIQIVGVGGLSGLNKVYSASTDNMFLGIDVEDEEETFSIWYSKDDDKIYVRVNFKYGTQVAYQEEITGIVLP